MKKNLIWIVLLGLVILLGVWIFGTYNSLVSKEGGVNGAWAQVENQYQRRFDLIPNLFETTKGLAEQEKAVFQGIADARSKVGQIQLTADALNDEKALANFEKAQSELGSALSRLLVVSENYPNLKSDQGFLNLSNQLEGTENRISTERMRFNEAVTTYNISIKKIPTNIIASIFGFEAKALFKSTEGSDLPPKIDFSK
jgi:LemA protein